MNLYPRSFLRLLVLGNVLVVLPLLAAVGYASLTVDDLTLRGEAVARQASLAATLGQALQEDMNQMERVVRQFQVLRDPSLFDEYAVVREEWRRSSNELAALLPGEFKVALDEMRKAEAAAYENRGVRSENLPQLLTALEKIKRGIHPLLDEANRLVEVERESFRLKAAQLRQRLIVAVLAALLLTGALLAFGRRMVARLWRRFERAILALGEGRLDRPIRLRGPDDMQRVGRRLEWLRRRMLALETERTRVMRHASHELKTPLATLREGVALLNEGVAGPLTQKQAKITGIMQTNAIRLQALIDGMLRMQQASHARDAMETSPIRFDKIVEQTLATLQIAARHRQVRVTGTLAPIVVEGGEEALATLAGNLISNAIKFSPDGGVVRVTLMRENNKGVLDVIDGGPGIGADERGRIFEPFYRGAAAKGVAGIGLGLAIAHEFALAHRGSLEIVDSERGAHFRAVLPLLGPGT